jgi:hypothetical protein
MDLLQALHLTDVSSRTVGYSGALVEPYSAAFAAFIDAASPHDV